MGAKDGEKNSVRIEILDPLAVANWDALVAALPGRSFFHTSSWAHVLERTYGYKPLYIARVEGEKLTALLPLMEVNSWLTGKRGVGLPFSDTAEVLGKDCQELFEVATREGAARAWKYWETRGVLVPEAPASATFVGHSLDLTRPENQVFESFDSSVRRAIRKAEKGVSVELSRSMEDMQAFYALHCLTRKKHGVPPQPFSFFANFHRYVISQNHGFVAIARAQGQPVSADVFVHTGTRAIYKYGASDERHQELRGSNLVMWRAIQWYIRAGFETLDFGRTDYGNEGLIRFKRNWGTTERQVQYCRYDLKRKQFMNGKDEAAGNGNRLARLLPVPVLRLAGALLYRHMG
jgi:CelD/BcsL family acetyltransferase involved in cellulose biosynthesis